jgi:hypothetical protein
VFSEQLERRLLLASPELDFSFGAGGISSNEAWGRFDDLRLLPDGKFLAAGPGFISRYRADGLLDGTFDGDGTAVISSTGREACAPGA